MRKILIVLFLVIVCLPMLLAFYFASSFAAEKVETMMKTRASHRYLIAENLLLQRIAEMRLKVGIIAQNRNIRAAIENKDIIELIDLLNGIHQDLGLNTLATGIEIFTDPDKLMVAEPRNPEVFADEKMIESILTGNLAEKMFFRAERLLFSVGVPVYGQNSSQPLAAMILHVAINENFVDQIKSVADADIVVFAEKEGSTSLLVSTLMVDGRRSFPVLTGLDKNIREARAGSRTFILKAGRFSCVNGSFFLAAVLEKRELTEILVSLRQVFIKTGLLAILVAMLAAFGFAGVLTGPVNKLVAAAKEFGAGKLEKGHRVSSVVPELTFLGDTFAEMTEQIRAKIEEIEAGKKALDRKVFDLSVRNLINQAIINKSEDSVLKELLEIVADTMQTRRCSMLLMEQATSELSLKVAVVRGEEEAPPALSSVVFASGEGFAGFAARHGQAIFSNDPLNDSRFKKSQRQIKNLISVPLFDEGKVIGVINVADRDEDFSEEDALMLQGIADQIAIALQKTRLYELAITDGLTQLFIHRYFQMRLESEIARANRSNEKLALIMFDIDHFKKFNDTYGHQVGDRVIKLVAEQVRKNIREGIDIAARYGGEEFTVIMPDTGEKGAVAFAERLRLAVAESGVEHENQQLKVTISLGCAIFPEHAGNRENLICNADSALYKSKELGRNRVSVFSSAA